ncbi:hypothetical protein HMPREF1219_00143 [Corynebacterium pyruviciproducens ATCC BAA-1742]|uniref:Single-stranded DNA-binding protein n=1 Tax=Corynebacterium pyruviciproducens ATCC BAA-1742 TaxID=1125779 RepID=S2Z283_9CORY|nr:hypothetical protein HMPREF1219_00143 [Corynebacterium pyruviciproducens ATCC BAA-1742]
MNVVTISGRLAADPDLRFTGSGQPVANLRIAHTPRRKNPQGQWEDLRPALNSRYEELKEGER